MSGETFSGLTGAYDVTMGDPSMNLAPKFEVIAEKLTLNRSANDFEDTQRDNQTLLMDQFSVNYNKPILIEEEDNDTIGDAREEPYSSSSSEQDEFEMDQEDGLLLQEEEGDILLEGAGQGTIEVL